MTELTTKLKTELETALADARRMYVELARRADKPEPLDEDNLWRVLTVTGKTLADFDADTSAEAIDFPDVDVMSLDRAQLLALYAFNRADFQWVNATGTPRELAPAGKE